MAGFWDRAGKAASFAFVALLVLVPMLISMAAAGLGAQRLLVHSFGVAGTTALAILAGGAAIDLLKGLCAYATFESWRDRSGSAVLWAAGFIILFLLSCLCQHATVKNLLLDAERAGTHASRGHSVLVAEIQALDDQIEAIKARGTPRPSATVSWAIKTSTVPANVRKTSADCLQPEDAFTSKACAPLRQLRAELAAAEDLERLEGKVSALRKEYAGATIVADRDPLATSFDELVAPLLHSLTGSSVRGEVGVPFLALIALEIFSCFGPTLIANRWRAAYPGSGPNGPGGRKTTPSASNGHVHLTSEKSTVVTLPVRGKRRVRAALGSSPLKVKVTPMGKDSPAQAGKIGDATHAPQPAHNNVLNLPKSTASNLAQTPAVAGGNLPTPNLLKGNVLNLPIGSDGARAVRAFVGMLERGKDHRATPKELAQAYAAQAAFNRWPALSPTALGMHLRREVRLVGGRKIKSGGQVYAGVAVPASWATPAVMGGVPA